MSVFQFILNVRMHAATHADNELINAQIMHGCQFDSYVANNACTYVRVH